MKPRLGRLWNRLEVALYWLRVKRDIRRRGWACVGVCDDDERLFWTYTMGFDETLGHPEIVLSGCSRRVTEMLPDRIFQEIKRGELVIEDLQPWELCGHGRYVWRRVHWLNLSVDWIALAMRRREERTGSPQGVTAFQLVMPDENGRYPWERGYDERLRESEPKLWRPLTNEVATARAV